ncbi:MAG: tripartite tricarboxylate transporter TctB family protein [Mailhella sp.]|nr:tripartite tricarboxylate transporter TctB family protein [Mailhella sp.]
MNKDRWTGLVFIIACALLWFAVIPQQTDGPDEAFVPRMATAGMFIPALIMLVRRPKNQSTPPDFRAGAFFHSTLPAMLLVLAYLLGVAWIGFFFSSLVFIPAALFIFGERRVHAFWITPAALLGGIYLVMVHFLHLELPAALLI